MKDIIVAIIINIFLLSITIVMLGTPFEPLSVIPGTLWGMMTIGLFLGDV